MDTQAWEEDGREVLDKFCHKMLISGYNQTQRDQIVQEGMARVKNIQVKVERGLRPMYRMNCWKKYERGIEMIMKLKSWCGNSDSVVFVQAELRERS